MCKENPLEFHIRLLVEDRVVIVVFMTGLGFTLFDSCQVVNHINDRVLVGIHVKDVASDPPVCIQLEKVSYQTTRKLQQHTKGDVDLSKHQQSRAGRHSDETAYESPCVTSGIERDDRVTLQAVHDVALSSH